MKKSLKALQNGDFLLELSKFGGAQVLSALLKFFAEIRQIIQNLSGRQRRSEAL